MLQGAEKFNAAMRVAANEQAALQKIAMTTASTYQELLMVYQAILAPALQAKLSVSEMAETRGKDLN